MLTFTDFLFRIFSSKLRISIFFLISSYYVFIFFYQKKIDIYNFSISANYVYLILLLNITPFIIFLSNKDERKNLPIFYLSLFYFLFSYTFYLLFSSFTLFNYESDHLIMGNMTYVKQLDEFIKQLKYSIEVFLLGLFSFNLGYFLFFKFIKKSRDGFKILRINNKELIILGLLTLIAVIFFYYIIDLPEYINGTQQLKFPLLYTSYGALVLYIFNNKKKISIYFLFLINLLILTPIIGDLLSGSYFLPFFSIFLIFIFYFYLDQKINIKKLLLFIFTILICFVIFGSKGEFRAKTWYKTNIDTKEKIFIYLNEMSSGINNLDFIEDTFLSRIYHSYGSLIIVTRLSPEKVDFWKGESYKILASKIIPRIFWKNKPSDELGNKFGHRYGELNLEDKNTSWNMPVLNEFYVNYGLWGVGIGMFLLGILFRFLSTSFSIIDNNNIEKIISFFILVPLFFLESHLSLLFGAVIQSYIFLIVLFILYKKVFKFFKII